ncbi:uncharacterized protein LOC115631703 [Scaptodrosophila lebanonensis]|uniref:Oxidative stress-responsive serine-rich protein 1 n=1 Tax=Drosophila lebanonensis TaxID=7225 RepID=A0A6J2U7T6_DROLE|nr:uncharacterized protein LOC115631703 [Scaptodrosophila lebanonensis]
MSTEELPADLGRLKIAPTQTHFSLSDGSVPIVLNPFYTDHSTTITSGSNSAPTCESVRSARNRKTHRRFRRRSESFLDDCKQADEFEAHPPLPDSFEIISNLRCNSGVFKLPLKKPNSLNKKNLLRVPILRSLNDCAQPKCIVNNSRTDPRNFSYAHKKSLAAVSQSSKKMSVKGSGLCAFGDLICECTLLLDRNRNSKTRRHSPTNTTTFQPEEVIVSSDLLSNANIKPQSLMRCNTTCSQQASNTASANCDDVTIDELASYFDTMVHIPRKMSSMAEMMYI